MTRSEEATAPQATARQRTASWTEALVWALALALAVGYIAWHWESLSQFAWKYDEGIYIQEAVLQLRGQRLYLDIWSERPPLFSWMLAAAFALLEPSVAVGRAVVLGTASLALLSLAVIGRRVGSNDARGRAASLIAPVLLVLLPHFHGLSARILIELPPVSLALLALALTLQYQARPHLVWPALAALAFAASLLIKPVTVPFYAPLVLLLWQGICQATPRWRSRLLLLAGFHGIMALPVAGIMLYYGPRVFVDRIVGTLFAMREAHALSLGENWQALREYFLADKWDLSYPWLIALAALGLIVLWARRRRGHALALVAWVGIILAALLLHTPVRRYHLFSLMPALIVPAAVALAEPLAAFAAWPRLTRGRRMLAIACALGLAWCVASLPPLARTVYTMHIASIGDKQQTPGRLAAINVLQQHTPPDSIVLSDDPMLAYKARRAIPPLLAAPSYKRVEAGELVLSTMLDLEERLAPSAIVFWENRFERIPGYADWVEGRHVLARVSEDEERIYLTGSAGLEKQAPVSTEAGLTLLASRVNEPTVDPGGVLTVDLLLTTDRVLDQDYTLTLNLLDPDGQERWGQSDLPPLDGLHLSSAWQPGQRILQRVAVDVSPDTPAGQKVLMLGFYGPNKALLPLRDATAPSNLIRLPERPVVRWAAVREAPAMQVMQSANLGDLAHLVGYDLSAEALQANSELAVTLYWQCAQPMPANYTAFVHLVDDAGALVAQSDSYPGGGLFPTTGWVAGEYITDRHILSLPAELPQGPYRLAVGMYDLRSGQRIPLSGVDHPRDHVILDTSLRPAP